MLKQLEILLCMIKDEIGQQKLPSVEKFHLTDDVVDQVLEVAKKHSLEPLIASAILHQKSVSNTEKQKAQMILYKYIYLFEQKETALKELFELFDRNNISYIKLKGARLRDLYPENWMRTSCDIDILIHPEDVERAEKELISELNYIKQHKGYHDVSFMSPREVHLELHFNIKEHDEDMDPVLEKVWDYSYAVENSREYIQTNEYFLFHILSHMKHHFIRGGCGIRSFIDLYLIKTKMTYDENVVYQLCKEAKIDKFYESVIQLVEVWFEGKEQSELTEMMESYILTGGVFGSLKNSVAVSQNTTGSKFNYLMSRLFMPYEDLKRLYPSIEGKKWLMPFYEVRRWYDRLAGKDISKYVREFKTSQNLDEQHVDEVKNMLEQLGLMK